MSHKILVIEDGLETLSFLGILLQAAGFDVLKASTSEEGLSLARQMPPDLVLLDIMMPDIDGWVICERLRVIAPAMPVIFVTALRDAESQSRGIFMGDDYIVKPFAPRELIQRLRAHLPPDNPTDPPEA